MQMRSLLRTPHRSSLTPIFPAADLLVLSVIMILLVFGVLQTFSTTLWQGISSEYWPTVEGEIVRSRIDTASESGYIPRIGYVYTVGDQHYTGSAITVIGPAAPTKYRVVASGMVERYPLHSTVQVSYNPDNPSTAVLKPGITGMLWIPVAIMVALLAGGTYTLTRALRQF